MKRNTNNLRRGSSWNKDAAGRPMSRAKTWSEPTQKNPQKDRRDWRKDITFIKYK